MAGLSRAGASDMTGGSSFPTVLRWKGPASPAAKPHRHRSITSGTRSPPPCAAASRTQIGSPDQ